MTGASPVPLNEAALMEEPKKGGFTMIEKNVTLSLDEIIQLRTAIRARLRELNRMLKHYQDLPGVEQDKAILEPLYERLLNKQDEFC